MRSIAVSTAACLLTACLLTACTSMPATRIADTASCDALAGDDWRRTAAPDVAAELLALAHVTTAPDRAVWYVAAEGARAACLPPVAAGSCGHVLHTFQPQVHRMWVWSDGTTRSETCAD